jgi:hypothetical protein
MSRALESLIAYTPQDVEQVKTSIDAFGFGCIRQAILPPTLSVLHSEAKERFALAQMAEQAAELSYKANVASLGPRAKNLLSSLEALDLLWSLFGARFALVDESSCLTYYGEGHHLGPHVDKPEASCTVTVIAYLIATSPMPYDPETGLALRIYGQDVASISEPRLTIPTEAGSLVFGRGSRFWHERPKLQKGEYVAALTGCYRQLSFIN